MKKFSVERVRRAAHVAREQGAATFQAITVILNADCNDQTDRESVRAFALGVAHLREELRSFMPAEEFRLGLRKKRAWKSPTVTEFVAPAEKPAFDSPSLVPSTDVKLTKEAQYMQAAARIREAGLRVTRPRLAEKLGCKSSSVGTWLATHSEMIERLGVVRAKKHENDLPKIPGKSRNQRRLERMQEQAHALRAQAFSNPRPEPPLAQPTPISRHRLSERQRNALRLRALISMTHGSAELCG